MQESAYREREGSPAVRFKEQLYDNYVSPGVTVRQKSDQTKKPAEPAAAKGSNTARVDAATYDLIRPGILPTDDHQSPYILVLTGQPVRTRSLVL
jgi:hypothetical protein